MTTIEKEILKEFDEKVSELRQLLPDTNTESGPREFGYKHNINDYIHTVTDWGNIRIFIEKALAKQREQIREEIQKEWTNSVNDTSTVNRILNLPSLKETL